MNRNVDVWLRCQQQAQEMGVDISDATLEKYQHYTDLLMQANQQFNLTAFKDLSTIISKIHLDSLSLLPAVARYLGVDMDALRAKRLRAADIGTGAGVPGLPLLFAWPHLDMTLVESTRKKGRFLQDAVASLGLGARVVIDRAESLARDPRHRECYDLVLARALAPLPALVELVLPFARPGGVAALPKGPGVFAELEEARFAIAELGGQLSGIDELKIPSVQETRYVVILEKVKPTPQAYPRRPGIPQRRPLKGTAAPK